MGGAVAYRVSVAVLTPGAGARPEHRRMTENMLTTESVRPGTYTVDPARSSVRFTATHVFGLRPVHGSMGVRSGTVTVAAEPRRSTASAEIDAASWATDDPRRDRDVRGRRFLDTGAHPSIGFRSTRLVRGPHGWQITGVLGVRGGSTEVTLDLTGAKPLPDGYRFTATADIDRVAAGVTAGRAIIGRRVAVTVTVCVTSD
jgi:polyisoprenoid-binding protein YceI